MPGATGEVDAVATPLNPFNSGSGFEWDSLGIMAGWFVLGLLLDLKFFRWEPREGGGRRRRGRRGAPLAASEGDG